MIFSIDLGLMIFSYYHDFDIFTDIIIKRVARERQSQMCHYLFLKRVA